QSAIDAASPGDTIRVYDGSYPGGIVVNKSVSIEGNSSVTTMVYDQDLYDGFNVTADDVLISGFNVTSCNHGIVFRGMTNGTVRFCEIVDNDHYGVHTNDTSMISISNNFIFGNVDGIHLYDTDIVMIMFNWIENNTKRGGMNEYNDGIRGNDLVTNVTIMYNDIVRNNFAIDLDSDAGTGFWDITAIHNTLYWQSYNAVWSENLNDTVFGYNRVYLNGEGVFLLHCKGTALIGNDISNNTGQGIEVYGGWAIISNNTICWNGLGIQLFMAHSSVVVFNEIFNNSGYGVQVDMASGVEIHHNNFYGNNGSGPQGYDDTGSNSWDNGTAGNFWDDYAGPDRNADGIGDWPYNLSGGAGAQDRFPLMDRENNSAPRKVPEMAMVVAVTAVLVVFMAIERRKR
ncbi:MAG: right-handed parallel beta-helix repeat-containing protein, partial [Thermoplasmata archaeon]|nr:right-handed parallel beta-helix repeat-containing protein [Thermoplasmata archaeon]